VLSIFVAVLAIHASAEEEYNLKESLQSPEPDSDAQFGSAVAISGDILVISEIRGKVGDRTAGKAHLFNSEGNLLVTVQSPDPNTLFSCSVAVNGDTMVVGEWSCNVGDILGAGRAYIFGADGNLQSTLQAPEPKRQGEFGWSMAVSGGTVVVGEKDAIVEDVIGAGRAYIFDSDGNLESTLRSPKPGYSASFGISVAADGDKIVVGEVYLTEESSPVGPGSVYVFNSEESHLTILQSPEPDNINFGWSVAISEDIIVVGESLANVEGNSKAGRAYIFDTDGNLLTTLQAPIPEEGAEFGCAVAINVDTIAVGEYKADVEAFNEGKAYVFDLDGNLLATLQSPVPDVAAYFGYSVAVNGDTIVVGEPSSKVEGKSKAGRAYIFGPGPGAEPEPEAVTTETKPAAEEKKPSGGIPGFPYESIILGMVIGAFVLWLLQRKR
jgi:hypothetical protein